jgi:hypothetical protein
VRPCQGRSRGFESRFPLQPSLAPAIHRASDGWASPDARVTEQARFGWQAHTLRFDDDSDPLLRALLLLRLDAAGISLHPVPTGAVAKW